MKNSWLIWLFIAGVIITVFVAFNYQGQQESVPLSQIFPEDSVSPVDVEYEFVDDKTMTAKPAVTVIPAVEPVVKPAALPSPSRLETAAPKEAPAAVPAKPAPAATSKADAAQGAYTIQVASFKEKAMADKVAAELKNKNFISHVGSRDLGEKGVWYRVYVGRYETKSQAETNLSSVKALYPDSFIITFTR
jgi:cell division septation protein DedD